MLDHVTINVSDLAKSAVFYERALAPLGLKKLRVESDAFCAFGTDEGPIFEISQGGDGWPVAKRVHVAFRSKTREAVDAFYKEALAADGVDNGPPGPRPEYSETYYAAFVRDPDDNNIESCYYESEKGV